MIWVVSFIHANDLKVLMLIHLIKVILRLAIKEKQKQKNRVGLPRHPKLLVSFSITNWIESPTDHKPQDPLSWFFWIVLVTVTDPNLITLWIYQDDSTGGFYILKHVLNIRVTTRFTRDGMGLRIVQKKKRMGLKTVGDCWCRSNTYTRPQKKQVSIKGDKIPTSWI